MIEATVPLREGDTIATIVGPWPMLAISIAGVVAAWLRQRRSPGADASCVVICPLDATGADGRGSAVTPVWVPEGLDGKQIVKIMKNKYGVTIAGGQDDYAGRIFRVGHLGYFGEFDIITTLAALEMTLAELGYDFERGAGIKAAEAVFMGE